MTQPRSRRHRTARGRLAAMSAPMRWAVVASFVITAALPFAQAARALHAGWRPTGDDALIAIRAHDVIVDPPLLGQPDSADSMGTKVPSEHLGPIESYLLAAPVAVAGGRVGLACGAAAIHAFGLLTALVLALRRGGVVLFALVAAALALVITSIGAGILHEPLNSLVVTFALVPLALAAWALWEGDLAVAPTFAVLAAIALQPHLAAVPFASVATTIGCVGTVRALRRGAATRRERWSIVAAAGISALAWLPVVVAEIVGRRSNLWAVWLSITEPRRTVGLAFGLRRLALVVAPIPFFARPSPLMLSLAHPGAWVVVAGLVLVGLAGVGAVLLPAVGRRRPARLLAVATLSLLVATAAASRLPVAASVRPDHGAWMWAGGALLWVALGWAAWSVASPTAGRLAPAIVAVLLVAQAVVAARVVLAEPLTRSGGVPAMACLGPFLAELRASLPKGTYLVAPLDGDAMLTSAPSIVLALDEAGYRTYVEQTTFSRGYDRRHHFVHQRVDGTLFLAGAPGVRSPDARLVADCRTTVVDPNDPGHVAQEVRLRAYVRAT